MILKMKFDLREYLKVRAEGDALTARPHRCVKLSQRCAPLTVNQGKAKSRSFRGRVTGLPVGGNLKTAQPNKCRECKYGPLQARDCYFCFRLMVDLGPGTRRLPLPVPSVLNAIVHLACLPFIHRQVGRHHARALPVPFSSALCSFLCLFLPFHLSNIRIRRSGVWRLEQSEDDISASTSTEDQDAERARLSGLLGKNGWTPSSVGCHR